MPHLHIEYSRGLEGRVDMLALCRTAHAAIVGTELFPLAGIRVRAFAADYAIVADGLPENDFAAFTLSVGAGRSTDALKRAGDAIFAALREALAAPLATTHFALSMEIRVSDPELNWKDTPIHSRLSAKG
jgi:5-carboxymethyl-2-hydroxymuconate isomerase